MSFTCTLILEKENPLIESRKGCVRLIGINCTTLLAKLMTFTLNFSKDVSYNFSFTLFPGKYDHGTPSKSSVASGASVRRKSSKMKQAPKLLRQFLAEFLGTFLLVVFGDGAIAQYKMLDPSQMNFITIALGYGLALMIGILVSGNVSGGHLNPAVTLALATIKKCSWKVIPVYWAAQYLGAFLGAAVVYGDYADGISANLGVNQTGAGIFSSFPNKDASVVTLVMDQALGTMCLLIIILAVTDKKNMNVISGLIPLLIGLGLAAIHLSLAFNAGCAINPARDLSP